MATYIDSLQQLKDTAKNQAAIGKIFGAYNLIDTIRDIAVKHDLNLGQMGVIYDLTNQLLTGAMQAKEFAGKLTKISKDEDWVYFEDGKKVDAIVTDLNEKIFEPIRKAMMSSPAEIIQKSEMIPRARLMFMVEA